MIELGDKVRDTLTGFEGIAVAKTYWLYGCVRIGVERAKLDKDGNPAEQELWFDEQRIVGIEPPKPATDRAPGGPRRDPASHR